MEKNAPTYTVTQLSSEIRDLLEHEFHGVWVEGEVSNFRPHGSGHQYFTLKDAGAQISCALFRGQAQANRHRLADGQLIQAFGNVSLYPARGQHQLIVEWVRPKGQGTLQARFEALKRQLEEEGLFDPARKRPLPRFPRTVAIVTSPTGAALQDMLNILRRRAPWLRVLVWPVRVQGEGAGREVAQALDRLSARPAGLPPVEAVIVGRGGGSIEDLWAFNEEIVARAIAACPIPVISAVGHEIDFTIADFVADLRAPTPSAAAELVVPDGGMLARRLEQVGASLDSAADRALRSRERILSLTHQALRGREPGTVLAARAQTVDFLADRLETALEQCFAARRRSLSLAGQRLGLARPDLAVAQSRERLDTAWQRFERAGTVALDRTARRLRLAGGLLQALGPQAVLDRGFSLTHREDGTLVTDPGQATPGTRLRTQVRGGEIHSVAE